MLHTTLTDANFKADLHTHTIYSDGDVTPQELLKLAQSKAINAISITDHDTILAYFEETTIPLAKELNIMLIPGIELSTEYDNHSIHVLGYNIDIHSSHLQHHLQLAKQRKDMRNEEIIKKLQNKGMDISMQDVYNLFPQLHNKIFNRSHIALTMVKKGYVKTYKEAFHNYIKEHGCCYVAGEKISVEEAIGVIHVAKGKAVLAHPHLLQKKQILTKLLEMNFDGIEIYYSHYKKLKIPKTQKKLIYTGGSDYHGTIRPLAHIGCSLTPKDQFEALLA